jgi:hypothetical protein
MNVLARLIDLTVMHPRLLWEVIAGAAAAVLGPRDGGRLGSFDLMTHAVPGFDDGAIYFSIDAAEIPHAYIERLRRTYESTRLVELAAIAIAGLGLYYGGGHEIRDVAIRGSAADYLVNEEGLLLEVAGRSRRSDLNDAWQQRKRRVADRATGGFFVCVAEFETFSGRLDFFDNAKE